jgi:hypothetical protein
MYFFFLSLPEHGTQPGGFHVKKTRMGRILNPVADQLDLNQRLLVLSTVSFLSSVVKCAALLIDTFSSLLSLQECKERAYEKKKVFSVVHVFSGKV